MRVHITRFSVSPAGTIGTAPPILIATALFNPSRPDTRNSDTYGNHISQSDPVRNRHPGQEISVRQQNTGTKIAGQRSPAALRV